MLGGLALFLISSQSTRFSGTIIWLLPWEFMQDQLGSLPRPLAGYPPAGAHLAELAELAVLAGIVALAMTMRRGGRTMSSLAAGGILAAAVICLAGAVQLRPVPAAELDHLASEAVNPASVQHCTTASQVRYCLYPGFGSLLPSIQAPVNGVLAHLPARPAGPLTVSQVFGVGTGDSGLTHGHPQRQVSRWNSQLQQGTPAIANTASAIYLPVGSWPAFGRRLTDARFDVALAAADWAVRIPITSVSGQPCVPLDQAREAIAIWLAILAAHPPAGELAAGLTAPGGRGQQWSAVSGTFVALWLYPGENGGQVQQFGAGPPQDTQAGYLLARAMTSLPDQRVARVLKDGWGRWVNVRTTDAQLAAALHIPMPRFPRFAASPAIPASADVQSPVCGS